MRRKVIISLIVNILISTTCFSQEKRTSELKELFKDAESWFFYEEYKDALLGYTELLKSFPDNHNLLYKTGICYLNIPGQKHLSLEYLEKASENISADYRDEKFREVRAPLDAVFRLGDAYRVNNRLDEAIEAYRRFRSLVDPEEYNVELVDEQIRACENARKLMAEPLYLDKYNMGGVVNSRFSDYNAVISADENVIVFMRSLAFYDAPMYSRRVDDQWTEPRNLTPELGEDQDLFVSSLSSDGKELYLYKVDDYDGNICVSFLRNDGLWSRITRLNDNINTKYWESHASISADGKILYFTSNRKGGYGDLDIYMSRRDSLFDWKTPVNLGPNINTVYNEETPFISKDGTTLYFSSYGHFNMGGYDIFYSNLLENGEWSKPLNMSYPVNTPDDDVFFFPSDKGYIAYASLFGSDSYGQRDIYKLEIYSDQHPRKFFVKGMVSVQDLRQGKNPFLIYVIDRSTGDTIDVIYPNMDTGEYMFDVVAGKYDLVFEGPGLEPQTQSLDIDKNSPQKEYTFNKELLARDTTAELQVTDTRIETNRNKAVDIHMSVEKGSTLVVETVRDNVVVSREEYRMEDTTFTYQVKPEEGTTTLKFALTDEKGNTSYAGSEVIYHSRIGLMERISPVPGEVVTAHNQLKDISFDNLQKALYDVRLREENVRTVEGLKDLLVQKSGKYGYTPNDVDRLFATLDKLLSTNMNVLIMTMKAGAGTALESTLSQLDPGKAGIQSSISLVNYLNSNASRNGYTAYEVQETILNPDLANIKLRDILLNKLMSITTGRTHEILATIDPDTTGAVTFSQLAGYLFNLADNDVIELKEMYLGITVLASDGNTDARTLAQRMAAEAGGNLEKYLSGIAQDQLRFKSLYLLIQRLLKKAPRYGYSEEEVRYLLSVLSQKATADTDTLRKQMDGERAALKKCSAVLCILLPVIAGLLIIFLIFFFRRRKKKENE